MIGQDCDQLVFVFRLQQVFDSASGQGCKGCVRGGENGERASALQGIHQTSGGQSGGQRGEVASTNGGVDNVLLTGKGRSREERGSDSQGKKSSADHVKGSILVWPYLA